MEKSHINTLKTIKQNVSISQIQQAETKFKKVVDDLQEFDFNMNQSKIYQAAIHGCQKFNQNLFELKDYGKELSIMDKNDYINVQNFQQPIKPDIKVVTNIQRFHSLSLHRSKSQNKNLKHSNHGRRNNSAGRPKNLTGARFSNKLIDLNNFSQPQTPKKPKGSLHKKTYSSDIKDSNKQPHPLQQSRTKKTIQKRVKLKTNSVISLNGQLLQEIKYKQCIPLKQFKIQQEDSFWQNAYRLRKGGVPVWYEVSKLWNKAQDNIKLAKQGSNKDNKKIIYENYDFNGELIPATNMNTKHKKPDQTPQLEVLFDQQNNVQNLQKYHQRQPRYARTVKKIQIHQPQYSIQQSQFLNNFQNLQWNKNIQYMKKQSPQKQSKQKSQKSLNISQSKRRKNTSLHQNANYHKKKKIQQQKLQQERNKMDHQKLIDQFQKIKFCKPQNQLMQDHNFSYGLSKYVKVKKFQQKQKKSKSHNYHTVNFFTTPQQKTQQDISSTFKMKTVQPKGFEKVRANKRLFKQVFNMSLKFIQPENRQDVVTIKLLKDGQKQKQNAQDSQKQRKDKKNMKTHCARNSDTLLFKKGFCIKPTIFKQMQENKRPQSSNLINRQSILHNSQKTFTESIISDQSKQILKRQQSQNRLSSHDCSVMQTSSKNNIDQNKRRSNNGLKYSINNNNIEKVFKKQTKKTLIKQSANDNKRQSFF